MPMAAINVDDKVKRSYADRSKICPNGLEKNTCSWLNYWLAETKKWLVFGAYIAGYRNRTQDQTDYYFSFGSENFKTSITKTVH